MIHLKDINKTFQSNRDTEPVTALSDVNLHIEPGEIYGIIGRSGAGKSTLLRLVNGLETPTSGEVWVGGREISQMKERELRTARQKIGMIFQHFNLLWSRTVWDNVAFPLEVAGKSKAEIKRKVGGLLDRVGLSERAGSYPSQLSGGQKQRVGIARALANEPDVLLCDEATSAVDPETTSSILQLLREINRDTGITLLLITHEMSVVEAVCQRVAVMEWGRIIETGDVQEIFRNPRHSITKQFVKQTLLESEDGDRKDDEGVVVHCSLSVFTEKWSQLESQKGLSVHVLEGELSSTDGIALRLAGRREEVEKAVGILKGEDAGTEVMAGVQ
ncbi:methionine ABC transporter ATP-binding protein [Paludifilum halophilum]|uniref:Methionine ABC transporter ATP-binding protein n=1 Tax=Paludifilum halophilum TaxID=1642702 RepID=A0A235B6X4_9BACL|nr:methionine ABC transporter ATP-binding protein [Paludifilum halophilum]